MSGYEICRELRDEFGEGLPTSLRLRLPDRVARPRCRRCWWGPTTISSPFAPDEIGRVRALVRRRRAGLSNGNTWGLTPREDEVLRLLASGLRQEEIASRLVVSRRTVGSHIQNVLRKMGASSRTQVVALAYRRDIRAT